MLQNEIPLLLGKYKSIWQLLLEFPMEFKNVYWTHILENLIPLFRKDTFCKLVSNKNYYPQKTHNCRYYIKPNAGSCGKGITIVNEFLTQIPENHTAVAEIIPPMITINKEKYKYDYRIWIGICSDMRYFICPTFIKRISCVPFDISLCYGSLTNTSLYSEQFNCKNDVLYEKANAIVKDVICLLPNLEMETNNLAKVMLTGWDFIEDTNNNLYVLEVNCNPSLNILHHEVMEEFLGWICSV